MKLLENTDVLSKEEIEFLEAVKRAVIELVPKARVMLYGSAARGERIADSDYDVIVISEHAMSVAEEDGVIGSVYDLELQRGVVVSLVFYSQQEWDQPLMRANPYREAVERDAVIL